MIWTVQRMAVDTFEVGDRIGQKAVGGAQAEPLGEIIVSEKDIEGWHLAWKDYEQPGKTFHWRGPRESRDTRWFVRIEYIITEIP